MDTCTLFSWKFHSINLAVQNTILILEKNYLLSSENNEIFTLKTATEVITSTFVSIWAFVVLEKVLKEFWVIRETSERTYFSLFNMVNNYTDEVVVVDELLKIKFSNDYFERSMDKFLSCKFPGHMKELVHEDSLERLKTEILQCIKRQKISKTFVHLTNKAKDIKGNYLVNSCLESYD
jgi:hypothetical protein